MSRKVVEVQKLCYHGDVTSHFFLFVSCRCGHHLINKGISSTRQAILKSQGVSLSPIMGGNDETKFQPVSLERPRTKGRPPKHYHPLLEKEKHLDSVVRRILPKHIADTVCLKGSRLAHLYGLPKTHKERLAMRPILSATGTYNYTLAKWLNEKLKQLSVVIGV